jgi:hypothetical protein
MAKELQEPQLFRFENPGEVVAGELVACEPCKIGGGEGIRFVIDERETADGKAAGYTGRTFYVLATEDLKKKIRPKHTGMNLEIAYRGEVPIPNSARGGTMREFRVMVLD